MVDGTLSRKLQELYELSQRMEDELQLADGDTVLERRLSTVREYQLMVGDFITKYNFISEELYERADTKTLLDFIVQWAIFDPSILAGLAEKLHLTQSWCNIPGRMKKSER
jgi:hypothetical protein